MWIWLRSLKQLKFACFDQRPANSGQVQRHLLPPRCFALAALVWPATQASLTLCAVALCPRHCFATAQQPTGTSLENLIRLAWRYGNREIIFPELCAMYHVLHTLPPQKQLPVLSNMSRSSFEHYNKQHIYIYIYIHIYIYIYIYIHIYIYTHPYIPKYTQSRSKLQYSHGVPGSCLKLVQSGGQMLPGLCLFVAMNPTRLWSKCL